MGKRSNGDFYLFNRRCAGINRLEISLEEALIVCENGKLRIGEIVQEMGGKEADYRKSSTDYFRKIKGTWTERTPEKEEKPYEKVLQGFADECMGVGKCITQGTEGRKSLLISNAAYLSSWEKRMVDIPNIGTGEELEFERLFEKWLEQKRSIPKEKY